MLKKLSLFLTIIFGHVGLTEPGILSWSFMPTTYIAIPLGVIRVTRYTHIETHSRVTSSGYILKDKDANKVCAISRDFKNKYIHMKDKIWIPGITEPCIVLDTMADHNRKHFKQRRWIDVYSGTEYQKALDFGIQHHMVYLIK